MDAERAGHLTAQLRDRKVMAHLDRTGVYECGIRVVLDTNVEALWDLDGAAGLDAEIVSDGVLIGFVPHVPGSEDFTDEQMVDCIATARYTLDGLHPPTSRADQERPDQDSRRPSPSAPPPPSARPAPSAPLTPHPAARHHRWADHRRRGRG